MKYRVLKEMPFARVGKIIELDDSKPYFIINTAHSSQEYCNYFSLVEDGWVEEVRDEQLKDKLRYCDFDCRHWGDFALKDFANVIKDHYLEVFDKAIKNLPLGLDKSTIASTIRKAIKEA